MRRSVCLQADRGLDEVIALPGGYHMTRRDLFKFLPLVGIAGAGYAAYSNAKVLLMEDGNLFPD